MTEASTPSEMDVTEASTPSKMKKEQDICDTM